MALASTSVHVVERTPQSGCCQFLCPQGELKLHPASPEDSPRSAAGSEPGSFQIPAAPLSPRAREILCAPSKSGVSVSYNPLGHLKVSPTGLQSQMLWGLVFPSAGSSGSRARCGAQTPCSLWKTSAIVIILPFVCFPSRSMGLDYTLTLPLLPILLWFVLIGFSLSHQQLLCK